MSVTINGSTGVSLVQDGVIVTADMASSVPLGAKNLIINGAMQISQRATTSTGITEIGYYTVDRWNNSMLTAGTWTSTQDTDAPDGFGSSLKMQCTTANASLSAGSYNNITTRFEGQNLQYLKKGTIDSKSLTVSFWVKSNKTGTYVAEMQDFNNSRINSQSFTIDTASTWEKKTITYIGDTSGALTNDNNQSLNWKIWLAAGTTFTSGTLATSWEAYDNANRAVGQVNLADSTDNYINITGVQLELGSTATPFEHRSYGQELALCQRYYQQYGSSGTTTAIGAGVWFSTTQVLALFPFIREMRTAPTMTVSGANWCQLYRVGTSSVSNDTTPFDSIGATSARINNNGVVVAGVAGQGCFIQIQVGYFAYLNAEL